MKSATYKLYHIFFKYRHFFPNHIQLSSEISHVEMTRLTVSMCWELVTIKKDKINSIGVAIYQKPDSNDCYDHRKQKEPSICKTDDDPNAAW